MFWFTEQKYVSNPSTKNMYETECLFAKTKQKWLGQIHGFKFKVLKLYVFRVNFFKYKIIKSCAQVTKTQNSITSN